MRTIRRTVKTTAKATRATISMRWFPGAFISLVVLLAFALELPPMSTIENAAHGFLSRLRQGGAQDTVVLLKMDDRSVRELGGQTPPAYAMAEAIRRLSDAGTWVIALEEPYTGTVTLSALKDAGPESEEAGSAGGKDAEKAAKPADKDDKDDKDKKEIKEPEPLDEMAALSDKALVRALGVRAKIVLPVVLTDQPGAAEEAPEHIKKHAVTFSPPRLTRQSMLSALKAMKNPLLPLVTPVVNASGMVPPSEGLSSRVRSVGHVNIFPDPDGVVRYERLVAAQGGSYYQAMSLRAAARYKALGEVPMDPVGRLPMSISRGAFKSYSLAGLLSGEYANEEFEDRLVFIGQDSTMSRKYAVPFGPPMSALEIRANAALNIMERSYLIRPSWAFAAECTVILYFGIIAAFVMPRLRLRTAGVVVMASVLPVIIISAVLFVAMGLWVMVYSPVLVLALGFAAMLLREFLVFGNRAEFMAEHLEANRMLGVELHGKGMLDMAFEKFRKCPVDNEEIRALMYDIALDFERKRMPRKAAGVYAHILKAGPFQDAAEKLAVIEASDATGVAAISGLSGNRQAEGTIISSSPSGELPVLGRYEIQKELGRGAMGVVYLGRDPKINREVAIKTLLYDEIEPELLDEIKMRFFQEAEAAGKLSHPNILTIFDVGEEHDMAYLAMEVLDGVDLKDHCMEGHLLDVREVLMISADTADALDYAHKNGVVHRDIKPANIMLLPDGTVKVTDFGIARVVESSKTQTGMVLGTPGYMSPEQVAGKKVDGRSDLFSLGAMMYELLSGQKAFTGDTITGIMYNITNSRYTSIAEAMPELPKCAVAVVEKLLMKAVSRRYKTGAEAASAIRECMDKLS